MLLCWICIIYADFRVQLLKFTINRKSYEHLGRSYTQIDPFSPILGVAIQDLSWGCRGFSLKSCTCKARTDSLSGGISVLCSH